MKYIKSPINYIGNKYNQLDKIIPLFPSNINTFVDLFGGSGTVLLNVKANNYIYNDINNFIVDIFEGIMNAENPNIIIDSIEKIISKYNLSKTNRDGFEKLRSDYNNGQNDWITLYTLMCYSFNYQFRFNNDFEYNSSFGKDRSCFSDRQKHNIILANSAIKSKVVCSNKSFTDFDYMSLKSSDFVYCDPPYLNSVGNYNDGKRGFEGWTSNHENSLYKILDNLNARNISWALSNDVSCNKELLEFAKNRGYKIHHIDRDYTNCNYQRKIKEATQEVLITNYVNKSNNSIKKLF
jgi:DNA adenine methylase/adenine-specific DNA-methyltransferase